MNLQKVRRHESKKLRDSAKGSDCQIRLPGICNFNPETTVPCHLNGGGAGTKHSDLLMAYGCSSCHDEIDRRTRKMDGDAVNLAFYEAIFRTQQIALDRGLITLA